MCVCFCVCVCARACACVCVSILYIFVMTIRFQLFFIRQLPFLSFLLELEMICYRKTENKLILRLCEIMSEPFFYEKCLLLYAEELGLIIQSIHNILDGDHIF